MLVVKADNSIIPRYIKKGDLMDETEGLTVEELSDTGEGTSSEETSASEGVMTVALTEEQFMVVSDALSSHTMLLSAILLAVAACIGAVVAKTFWRR